MTKQEKTFAVACLQGLVSLPSHCFSGESVTLARHASRSLSLVGYPPGDPAGG